MKMNSVTRASHRNLSKKPAQRAVACALNLTVYAMRKRYRVLVFVAVVAAFIVPVGFALSLESPSPDASMSSTALVTTVAVLQPVSNAVALLLRPVSNGAWLLLLGTLLLGLAAFVRRGV